MPWHGQHRTALTSLDACYSNVALPTGTVIARVLAAAGEAEAETETETAGGNLCVCPDISVLRASLLLALGETKAAAGDGSTPAFDK